MQSPFIGVSDSCSIRHTKRENLFDVSFFFFLKTFSVFPALFFFFLKKTKPANSERHRSSVPASLANCRVQQTSLVLLENNYRAPRPSLAPCI